MYIILYTTKMDILNFISWIKGSRQVTTVNPTKTLLPLGIKDTRRDDGYLAATITVEDFVTQFSGGIGGSSYVYVMADGTDIENAAELQAAYVTAQSMSPSATNRITVIAAPGNYNFQSTAFTMNTQYIDLVSLDGNRSIVFNSSDSNGTISITANDVFVKGLDTLTKAFNIATNLNLLKVENCKVGDGSFGVFAIVSGTFTDCTVGGGSFGFYSTASGTFNNCITGGSSFGSGAGYAAASGIFNDCIAEDESFGGSNGTASGTFFNCRGGIRSFSKNNATGTFNNCISGEESYGRLGTLSGKLYYCRLTAGTFATVSGAGITRYCLDGTDTANNQG